MKIIKCNKLVCNLYDENNYAAHIRTLLQALNRELIPKKIHKVIQFNLIAWLKSCMNMNTKSRTKAKNGFEKRLFKANK